MHDQTSSFGRIPCESRKQNNNNMYSIYSTARSFIIISGRDLKQ